MADLLKDFQSLYRQKTAEEVKSMADIDSAVSGTMKAAINSWWEIFRGVQPFEITHRNYKPLPVAYLSTAHLAKLVVSEIKFEIPDEVFNAYVQKNLLPTLERIVQLTLAGGYTVIKPYLVPTGEMFFDFGTSRDFVPVALDENGHITEGVFYERIQYHGKIYERREHHTFRNGVHAVKNTAVIYGSEQLVELSDIPRWSCLLPYGEIETDIPMIATFRTPYANNIDLNSELPVSIYANSIRTLAEINNAHSEYCAEFRKMSAKVFADSTILHGNKGIPDDYFVSVSSDGVSAIEKQIMAFAPKIRENEHSSAINMEIGLYESQIGLSSGTFSFDSKKGLVTATQVLSEDRTTYNTVCQIQRQLRPVLETLSRIIVTLARFYGLNCNGGECAIEFGDSVFEDTGTEFNRRMMLVQAGLLKPEVLNAWYFGVPLERARDMLPPVSPDPDGTEDKTAENADNSEEE